MKSVCDYRPIYKPGTRELLCRVDLTNDLIEIIDRRIRYVIDLAAERERAAKERRNRKQQA